MSFEAPRHSAEHPGKAELITLDSEAYKKVQPLLAMRLYRDDYFKDTSSFDIDPRHASRDRRHEAIDLWGRSLSNLFDEYIRANPALEVSLSDDADVEELYRDFKRWLDGKKETVGDLDRQGLVN
ncbi:hypothetical protein FJY93_00030 [Candidatus Kaiserbacteria bacterium]|nr:hypothetical protein [Candidatus Kaiserbacteria bacterium]